MAYNINLYPPQFLTTVMPGFIIGEGCKIYFSLSNNSKSNIAQLHVTVTDQRTNMSVLNKEIYLKTNMIKLISKNGIFEDEERATEDRYYFILSSNDIQNGFQPNIYYKVQIRFSSRVITDQNGQIYKQENQVYFSEWSTVCLIRGMTSKPKLFFTEYPNQTTSTQLSALSLGLHGYIQFADGDLQKLKSYIIKIYNSAGELIQDSKEIKVNQYYNSDVINYNFISQLQENEEYTLTIQILTNFYYQFNQPQKYTFEVIEPSYSAQLDIKIEPIKDTELGYMGIRVYSTDGGSSLANLIIKRTSSESNFKVWTQVHATKYESTTTLDYTWLDYTVKSGVFYKYAVQILNSRMQRKGLETLKDPIMILFDNIFLISDDKQLAIKFNPQISSFTYNIAEGKTDTIGSKFPFFRRNGSIYYRQFPLSGTITHFMNIKKDLLKASRQEIYRDATELYEQYNYDNDITPYEDYIYERDFREKVIDFLYANDIKLFKSLTEGNLLVKISDISFTPNQTLGRMIWDFSCTCYEIAEPTYEQIRQLGNIITIQDTTSSELTTSEYIYGQLIMPDPSFTYVNKKSYFYKNEDIIQNILKNKYLGYGIEKKDTYQKIDIECLSYLRIQMLDKPYLINMDNMTIIENNPSGKNTALGYIVNINGIPIFINKDGRYELSDSNDESNASRYFQITSISFPKNTQAIIDYIVKLSIAEDTSKLPKSIATKETIGQLFGTFTINTSIYRQIYQKYYYKEQNTITRQVQQIQELNNLWGVRITGRPGLAFGIKDNPGDMAIQINYLNDTGVLEFYDTESSITLLHFLGYHVTPKVFDETLSEAEIQAQKDDILNRRTPLKKTQYLKTSYTVVNLNDTSLHIPNIVVKYQNQDYIYYDEYWYPIDLNTGIISVPRIEAIVDYYAELITKEYEV